VRSSRLTAVLATLLIAPLLTPTAEAAVLSHSGVLARVHTAGRAEVAGDSLQYSWPGVYFEGRFRGIAVGIVLNDAAADYDVQVDGVTVATLVTPGRTTHWITGLTQGVHGVRLVKRSESPWATSEFGGFVAAPGGAILGRPAARHRQIELIGDSFTAGYGNMSDTRDCTGEQVNRTTDADLSFGALTAHRVGADYQINAYSGRGMVRNFNGSDPQVNYRTFYDRALLSVDGDVWPKPRAWHPQVVVIGLGINDFSTAINPGEPWTPDTLRTAYHDAYQGFLDKIRARYGPGTVIVVSATFMSNTTALAELTQQIVQERNNAGDNRVRYWFYDGLDYLGCHFHPSRHDHQLIADKLTAFLATLPLHW
jgi:lysophospholipase L1-like esterase